MKETVEELKNTISFLTEGKKDVDLQVEKQKKTFREAKKKRDDAWKGRSWREKLLLSRVEDVLQEFGVCMGQYHGRDLEGPAVRRVLANACEIFSRITLVHKEKTERLTFDLNIQFQDSSETKSLTNLVICELKQGATNRSSIFYQITKKRLIRPLRVSKYCVGMMNFYSALELKQNRFKKKTLSLNKIIC